MRLRNPGIGHGYVVLAAWTAAALLAGAVLADVREPQRFEHEGIAVALELETLGPSAQPREGEPARFSFHITDTATGTPLSGVFPAAWMDLRPPGEAAGGIDCQQKVEAFVGGGLLNPPELDLNVYYVLALNQDNTISVVDPLFGFGTTKLLDMVFLDAPGEDWVLSPNGDRLFVSVPSADHVAVVDTDTWNLTGQIETPPGPRRLRLSEDGSQLWASLAGDGEEPGGLAVIDTRRGEMAAHLSLGELPADLVFGAADHRLYASLRGQGQVAVIDTGEPTVAARLDVGGSPSALGFSELAETVYAVDGARGRITAIGGESGREIVATIEAEKGLGEIFVAPGGRLAFVVNGPNDLLHIMDTASNRVVQTGPVEDHPDQVAFSDHLAYLRHRGSEIVLMIHLLQVGREGEPIPMVDFPGGHTPFGEVSRPSPAAGIVQAPGATAVLVANPADRAIYYYKEGMAAPMGHFQNYGREPRAVLALDRSLEEGLDGIYQTSAMLRRPGTYDLAFFLDAPRTFHCFEVEVLPSPELEAERARIRRAELELVAPRRLEVGDPAVLRLRLLETGSGQPIGGLEDLRITTFRGPGLEQHRRWARPRPDGSYEVDLQASAAGLYRVLAQSASARLPVDRVTSASIWAESAPESTSPTRSSATSGVTTEP